MIIDKSVCNNCGLCVAKCYFNAIPDGHQEYKVYIGGRWGKKVRIGSPIHKTFTKDEVLNVIEKAILLYKNQGIPGERFGSTIDRIGIEKIEEMLVTDNL